MWKICKKCKKEMPVTMFFRNKAYKDGYYSQCKECLKKTRKNGAEKDYKTREDWRKEGDRNMRLAMLKHNHLNRK